MSASKEWQISLLILLVILSCVSIWRPWQGLNPEIRGIQFGIDIRGGSKIYLMLEASHMTLRIDNEAAIEEIDNMLKNNQLKITEIVSPYNPITKEITVEIGRAVTKERIENIIDNKGEVISVQGAVSSATRDEVIELLRLRVDPFGTLGTQFKAVGDNLVLFEVALPLERAIELLGRQGRLEIFIGENPVLYGDDITDVGSVRLDVESQSYCVPFSLSKNGTEKWASASAGKVNYPTAIYLDRPSDETILLFHDELLGEMQGMTYDENRRMFYLPPETIGRDLLDGVYLRVTAAKIEENSLPPETLEFLREQYGVKTKIILLGEESDFAENIILTVENLGYSVGEVPRLADETGLDWVQRVCGLRSTPTITEAVAGKPLGSMVITTGGKSDYARKRAEDLRIVLSQRLPVGISFESEEPVEPRLGAEFMDEALRAVLVAFVGVGVLVYIRYRRLKIAAAIMGVMLSTLIITLGVASALGWSIGLAEIGGLIVVVGTGVDHQIIITDEVLRGALPHAQRMSLKGRIGRAFSIIFAAAATTIAAMVALAYVGFGVMRGFALITIVGVLIGVLLARPAYASILSFIMAKEKPEIMA
jgi:preprotein translocase subunit SecD